MAYGPHESSTKNPVAGDGPPAWAAWFAWAWVALAVAAAAAQVAGWVDLRLVLDFQRHL